MSQALYKKLTTEFLSKVQTGVIKVGERLPPESEYAEQLGVSRSTVRLAFGLLEKNGIITRTQRGGTTVVADKPVKRYHMVGGVLFDVLGENLLHTMLITDINKVLVEDIVELNDFHEASNTWMSCSSKRYVPNKEVTFLVRKSYIPEYYSDISVAVGDHVEPLFKLIEQRYSVSVGRIKKSLTAEQCPESIAVSLGLNEGDPILCAAIEVEDSKDKLMEVVYVYFDTTQFCIESEYRTSD